MDVSTELEKSQQEVNRLVRNWQTLLEAMPEMVFLIRDDFVIEYQNRSGHELFGDLRGSKCCPALRDICTQCLKNIDAPPQPQSPREIREAELYDIPVEYSTVPFDGYAGDRLIMVVMRDVSQRKKHEQELLEFNTNIEVILKKKIDELKES